MLRLLINDLKFTTDVKDDEGRSVMHQAAQMGHDLMIYMLAEMGHSVNALDHKGNTPLHEAVLASRETSTKFLLSLGAAVNATNDLSQTPLHLAVQVGNLRICKDLAFQGADRKAKNKEGQTALELAKATLSQESNFKSFSAVLSQPWYTGCPVGKLPFMPIERNNRNELLFLFLFVFIWLNQIFVVEPVLDVWYFMLSTTLCMTKLAITFGVMTRKQPGYVEQDSSLDWVTVMQKVPSKHLCLECKVIKPPRSLHCNICNKCVDRYEAHSFWTNTCVGRQNAGYYFMFVFYVWLNVFLIGWISMASIKVTACELAEGCVYAALCVGCNNLAWHYFICYFDMIVCFGFMIPATYHLWLQCCNFGRNETTYERFARKTRRSNQLTADDSFVWEQTAATEAHDAELLLGEAPKRRGKAGCWANCGQMCCNKTVVSQKQLMKCILQDLEYSQLAALDAKQQ